MHTRGLCPLQPPPDTHCRPTQSRLFPGVARQQGFPNTFTLLVKACCGGRCALGWTAEPPSSCSSCSCICRVTSTRGGWVGSLCRLVGLDTPAAGPHQLAPAAAAAPPPPAAEPFSKSYCHTTDHTIQLITMVRACTMPYATDQRRRRAELLLLLDPVRRRQLLVVGRGRRPPVLKL